MDMCSIIINKLKIEMIPINKSCMYLLFFFASWLVILPGNLFAQDFDMDGVPDSIDIDDDGDGILDTLEKRVGCSVEQLDFSGIDTDSPAVGNVFSGRQLTTGNTLYPGAIFSLDIDSVVAPGAPGWVDVRGSSSGDFALARNANGSIEATATFSEPINFNIVESTIGGNVGSGDFWTFTVGSGAITVLDIGEPDLMVNNLDVDYVEIEFLNGGDNDWLIEFVDVSSITSLFISTNGNNASPLTFEVCGEVGHDQDGDLIEDHLDTDSDNDGVDDFIEGSDVDHNGIADVQVFGFDTNGNGLDDNFEEILSGIPAQIQDTDVDGIPDYLDIDDDNDTIMTMNEDVNMNGDPTDDDTDSDGTPNYLDDDDDGDGVSTIFEDFNMNGNLDDDDFDSDTVPDYLDSDDDNDTVLSVDELDEDTDGDTFFNIFDIDDDGDGILTMLEDANGDGNPANDDTDGDGLADYLDIDADGDGLLDEDEGFVDTDADTIMDFQDTDSDNDTVPDSVEAFDANMDGVADVLPMGFDSDNDGLDEGYESVIPALQDSDGDLIIDVLDDDDDNDGTLTQYEDENGNGDPTDDDSNSNGMPNYLDALFTLSNTFYGFWNSFLEQTTVFALYNNSPAPVNADLTMYDLAGVALSSQTVTIQPNAEFDILVNTLPGYTPNNYGTVRIDFPQPGSLDGYAAVYRYSPVVVDPLNPELEFAIVKEFTNPSQGTTYAVANTLQPSLDAASANNPVFNWLQIVNQESAASKGFTVNRYDSNGIMFDSQHLTLGPLARMDTQAGHEDSTNPSLNRPKETSLVEIVPDDSSARYSAELFRFSDDAYALADNLSTGDVMTKSVFVSTGGTGDVYAELYNVSNTADVYNVEVRNYAGVVLSSTSVAIAPKALVHIPISPLLGLAGSGVATASSVSGEKFIFKATTYFRSVDGHVQTAMTRHAGSRIALVGNSAHNTFLSQFNWLKLYNFDSSPRTVNVEVFNIGGTSLGSANVIVPAGQGVDAELQTSLGIPIGSNTYGKVRITSTVPDVILADIVKTKSSAEGPYLDSVKGLPVR